MRLGIRRLDAGLPMPAYAHDGDAGLDLYSAEDVTLAPMQRALVATGIAVAIPEGYAGLVLPRSGLAVRHGLSLVNAPGLVDRHSRGEVKVVAVNLDAATPIVIARGDRIAQLVIQAIERVEPAEVEELDTTARGEGGFGSSGS
jgi:dUTP pyrophosphatase